ncbi:hypothetical protein BC939DRAFT_447146 [Gamsiella multidivaricata]|uniref:uncharacterized protein n=1 Tax=Gamsiella multidivaricata TaxID=101098 RepID=UPI00221EEA0C|nr:uncharacterized protein BC939DRAFT_447146 [Gamsiella multidivaricata]KAI7826176.1 hypothetical protein BC939DRAFT_447146 [Gamsiella multidivaricata]
MTFIKSSTCLFLSVLAVVSCLMMGTSGEPACCDAVVPSSSPSGKIGLFCFRGGLDCAFSRQVTTDCEHFTSERIGLDCK